MIGIYKITNTINNKVYIGQSWKIEVRLDAHKRWEKNGHLKRSFEKYGIENFKFETLKTFDDKKDTQKMLDLYEDIYIQVYYSMDSNFGYNKKSGGARGKLNEESIKKMKKSFTENGTREKFSNRMKGKNNPMYGKKFSEETRDKMRASLRKRKHSEETKTKMSEHRKGMKYSEETKKKITEAQKHRNPEKYKLAAIRQQKPVLCIETGITYESIKIASEKTGCEKSGVSRVARGERKQINGFTFKFI